MPKSNEILENIIINVLTNRTECTDNTKKLISAEILAKLIHETTIQEDNYEVKSSQSKDTDQGITE